MVGVLPRLATATKSPSLGTAAQNIGKSVPGLTGLLVAGFAVAMVSTAASALTKVATIGDQKPQAQAQPAQAQPAQSGPKFKVSM
jgi:hypothetical protein